MYNILTLNKISKEGLAHLDAKNYTVSDACEAPDGVLVRSAAMHDMVMPESLLCIARAGAGVNNIPVDACTEKGIVVFNTPGANANAVKELALCGLLLASRKIVDGINWAKTLETDVAKQVEKGKSQFVGPELMGKTLGIIGLGAIGGPLANAAHHIGMDVLGYDPYISVDAAWSLSRTIKKAKTIEEIYENCDYISIHVPATPETKGSLNAQAFSMMKDGVRIINFARGELVNEADMAAALESGKIASYVCDFPTEATLKMKNCVCIPHLGASTYESEENCANMAVSELSSFLETGNIKNSVNFPNAELARTGDTRICIIHKNIPDMLRQIMAVVSEKKINIENMVNKSRQAVAYTMLDIDGDASDELVASIKAIDGIVRVRVIK